MMKIPVRSLAKSLVNDFICAAASMTPKTPATEVFLSRAIRVLARGGTEARNACGRTTCVITPEKGSPIARAASACPSGTALMPARSDSQTKHEVYKVSATTAAEKKAVKS
jgi:hypothetical protein